MGVRFKLPGLRGQMIVIGDISDKCAQGYKTRLHNDDGIVCVR
jgi:hypothetical protein